MQKDQQQPQNETNCKSKNYKKKNIKNNPQTHNLSSSTKFIQVHVLNFLYMLFFFCFTQFNECMVGFKIACGGLYG